MYDIELKEMYVEFNGKITMEQNKIKIQVNDSE